MDVFVLVRLATRLINASRSHVHQEPAFPAHPVGRANEMAVSADGWNIDQIHGSWLSTCCLPRMTTERAMGNVLRTNETANSAA
jgi:hypothetical protein